MWGVQYLKQQNSALSPADSHSDHAHRGSQQLLNNNTMQNLSAFGLQSHQWDTVRADIAARVEKQTVQKSFDHDKVMAEYHSALPAVMASPSEAKKVIDHYQQLTKPHKQTAVSVASSIDWQFLPRHTLSLSASHQQRLPTAQELYAHGMHLATNSFEMGNKDLNKEKSTNLELALLKRWHRHRQQGRFVLGECVTMSKIRLASSLIWRSHSLCMSMKLSNIRRVCRLCEWV